MEEAVQEEGLDLWGKEGGGDVETYLVLGTWRSKVGRVSKS